MMGERKVAQEALFYGFSLERHVPADHLLWSVDRFVDLSGVRGGEQGGRAMALVVVGQVPARPFFIGSPG